MHIIFNINYLALEGFGPTLVSLLRHCSHPKELNFVFLCSGLPEKDKSNIERLLKYEGFEGKRQFLDFNAAQLFGHLKPLHGDWTAYGRLLIPELIPADTALYLDSDLIVLEDVLELKNFDFGDKILAAVYGSTVEWTLEKDFLLHRLNWKAGTGYFNSGVLLFNLQKWREEDIDKKLKELSDKYLGELTSGDQTLLNAVCEGRFAYLPDTYNQPWFANGEKPENSDKGILHFVGSPKPWDFLGRALHGGYEIWSNYNISFWKNEYGKITLDKGIRTWKIRHSIFKNLKNKLFSK